MSIGPTEHFYGSVSDTPELAWVEEFWTFGDFAQEDPETRITTTYPFRTYEAAQKWGAENCHSTFTVNKTFGKGRAMWGVTHADRSPSDDA